MTAKREKGKVFWWLFVLVGCLAAGSAQAEQINLPATGQDTCYSAAGTEITCTGTGQDGEFQAGVAWPSPRFSQVGSGCAITDNLTRLMWARNTMLIEASDWNSVVASAGNLTKTCGHSDWRAANATELASLVNANNANLYSWLGAQGFKMQSGYYFSSTFYQNGNTTAPRAWVFNPVNGSVMSGSGDTDATGLITSTYYPWVVRSTSKTGTASARVAQTGQTLCYDAYYTVMPCSGTGQDGEFRAGAAWGTTRFTDNGDGTVTDSFTGLMWAQDAMTAGPDASTTPSPDLCVTATVKTWEEALSFVQTCLNSADDPYLGYRDWRLPNRNELASLTDRSQDTPALPTGYPFTNVMDDTRTYYPELGGHWSSTTSVRDKTSVWITEMTYGDQTPYANSGTLHVWPVRGNYWLLTPVVDSSGSGSGTISMSPAGVDCSTYCVSTACPSDLWPDGSARYNNNKKVTLTAKPDKSSVFAGWTTDPAGLCSGKAVCKITMTSDVTATASFTSELTLVVSPATKSFGTVKTGKTSAATFKVANRMTKGKQSFTIDSIDLGGTDSDQFTVDTAKDKCSGTTLAAGKSCTFRVIFEPTSTGTKSATATVVSADDSTGTTNVSILSGTAVAP